MHQCLRKAFSSQLFQPIVLKELASRLCIDENSLLTMSAIDFDEFTQKSGQGRFIAIKDGNIDGIIKARKAYQRNQIREEFGYLSGSCYKDHAEYH